MSATASGAFQTTASVMSTAMSRMLSFIDTEMEQMICFNSDLDIENFINGKQAIFFVVDEKSSTKNFLVSLLVRQTYNELLCASEHFENNKLPHRVYYYLDEFGTYTAIEELIRCFLQADQEVSFAAHFYKRRRSLIKNTIRIQQAL